ncbi:MAG: helix-turn-helix domain-containing protein [Candidatus Peribacteraceae bacterium]|nr:helix-turn-helix domain-containing protein [Candidatus Peribacteraceae bacterium]
MKHEFYLTEEVAEMLRVSNMTVYRCIKAGKLNAHKFGKDWRISKADLEAFLKAHRKT